MSSSDSDDSRTSIRFADRVDPDDSVTLTHTVEEAATVEQMTVRIYRGAEHDLHVEPYIDRSRGDREQREPLVTYQGKEFIDGDNDFFEFPLSREIEPDQNIGVEVSNLESQYGYDFAVDLVVDRAGGTTRILPGILGRLL
jgi:hypothetical protein